MKMIFFFINFIYCAGKGGNEYLEKAGNRNFLLY